MTATRSTNTPPALELASRTRRHLLTTAALVLAASLSGALASAADIVPLRVVPDKSSVDVEGTVETLLPPDRFTLDDGAEVVTTDDTEWRDGLDEFDDLEAGQQVRVIGTLRDDGVIEADEVRLRDGPGSEVEVVGTVSALLPPDRFVVDGSTTVVTTEATEWRGGLDGFDDLTVDQQVRVRGTLDGDGGLLAERVELESEEQELEVTGTVSTLLPPDRFVVDDDTIVVTTADTEWKDGLAGFGDLSVGQRVRVRGRTAGGSSIEATEVRLLDDDPGGGDDESPDGVDFESNALLVELLPPDRFAMSDGRTYTVDADTEYDPVIGSYTGLVVRQYLEVHATHTGGGVNLASKIEYEGDQGTGQGYEQVTGTVGSVDSLAISLTAGPVVAHDPSTVWSGDADRWWSLEPGWTVEITAFRDLSGGLIARTVRAADDEGPTTSGHDFEPRQALVLLTPGADPATVAGRHGAVVEASIGTVAHLFTWQREIDDGLLTVVDRDAEVEAVEPNYRFRDPESVRRRYVIVDGAASQAKFFGQGAVSAINLDTAARHSTGDGVVVAVIDTGVDPTHPLLTGRVLAGGLDLVAGDDEPWEERNEIDDDGDGDVDEAAGHGTFAASLVTLVAPDASILPYRVLDDDGGGTAFDLARALADAIARDVDLINLSLTYGQRSTAVDLLLEEAAGGGIIVVAAAGNDGMSEVPFPASDSHVIGVTAVAAEGAVLAQFANRSELVVMAAPGEEIYGAVDDGRYGTWSGTSMAAPFIAGAAALLLSMDPDLDPFLVKATLEQGGSLMTDGPWTGRALDAGASVRLLLPRISFIPDDSNDQGWRRPGRRLGGDP